MRVEPGWIDYNGHLNMAYYNVLFDRAVDEVYEVLGLGLAYVGTQKHSTFTAEVHVRYLRELLVDAPVRVTFRLLGFDSKRMHYFEELHHAGEGWLSATSENMALNVDMTAKKVRRLPGRRHGAARRHEGGARPAAAARWRRPADRHAASAVTELLLLRHSGATRKRREGPGSITTSNGEPRKSRVQVPSSRHENQ